MKCFTTSNSVKHLTEAHSAESLVLFLDFTSCTVFHGTYLLIHELIFSKKKKGNIRRQCGSNHHITVLFFVSSASEEKRLYRLKWIWELWSLNWLFHMSTGLLKQVSHKPTQLIYCSDLRSSFEAHLCQNYILCIFWAH